MTKTLKHYKRQHGRTRRLRKGGKAHKAHKAHKGGKAYSSAEFDLGQLKRLEDGHHLFAVHSSDSCGYCKQFKPEWEQVIERLTPHPDLTVAKLGPAATDYMNNNHYGEHNYGVNGVPTIVYYVVNKEAPREYQGERTADEIIKWLTKTMEENNLEVTIKPKAVADADADADAVAVADADADADADAAPVSFEEPEEVPESFDQQLPSSMDADAATTEQALVPAPESATAASSELAPAPGPESTATSDTMADAFPAAPLSPASIAATISTKANDLNDTLKSATESATSAVSNTVSDIGNKLTNLFSSAPSTETPVPAPAQTSAQETTAPLNVPQVPSLVGGLKRRKITRRKHRKSKSTRKSKKSKKSRK